MDRQGSTEGAHSDQGGDSAGIEEGMWQLGLGDATSYPDRPGEPDCIYYLRTGFCGYGDRCRFNHPRDRSSTPVAGVGRVGGGDYPERSGQPICQYFLRTGSCKFGTSCKYHHPRQGAGSVSPYALNIYGYPLRPGEKECSYYMKTGQCKFGMTCKFHHPQPTNVPVPTPTPAVVPPVSASAMYPTPTPAPQPYGLIPGNWPGARPSMVPGSYYPGPYGPMLLSPGVVPLPGWAPYPAFNPLTNPNTPSPVAASQLYGLTPLSPSAPAYTGAYQAISSSASPSSGVSKENLFPQRLGQPECQYYLKTGDCKFGSSCKYHHPAEWVVPESSSALSPMGLPLRPGTPTCSYYAQHGICKYGPACKFDHPMGTLSYSPSASSLSDMPVAPLPVGSSVGTLAPSSSSSSSDLRNEGISGSNKESAPTFPSTANISNGSGGSVSSKSGSISLSSVQQSRQSTAASVTDADSTGHGGAPS